MRHSILVLSLSGSAFVGGVKSALVSEAMSGSRRRRRILSTKAVTYGPPIGYMVTYANPNNTALTYFSLFPPYPSPQSSPNSSSPGHPAPSERPSRSPPSPRPWPRSPSRTTRPSGPPESRATRLPSAPSERPACKVEHCAAAYSRVY